MANWGVNSDYKIDTWDPKSVKSDTRSSDANRSGCPPSNYSANKSCASGSQYGGFSDQLNNQAQYQENFSGHTAVQQNPRSKPPPNMRSAQNYQPNYAARPQIYSHDVGNSLNINQNSTRPHNYPPSTAGPSCYSQNNERLPRFDQSSAPLPPYNQNLMQSPEAYTQNSPVRSPSYGQGDARSPNYTQTPRFVQDTRTPPSEIASPRQPCQGMQNFGQSVKPSNYPPSNTFQSSNISMNDRSMQNLPQQNPIQPDVYNQQPQFSSNPSPWRNQLPANPSCAAGPVPPSFYNNPLIGGPQDFRAASEEEDKIKNMRAAAQRDLAASSFRKPTTIAKAALAQISRDLDVAGKPFESPGALKSFKQMSLGLAPTGDCQSSMQKLALVSKIGLDPLAKEFVPKRRPVEVVLMEAVDKISYSPASFDEVVPALLQALRCYSMSEATLQSFTKSLFEACLFTPGFSYDGSRLCDALARPDQGIKGFRKCLFRLAQQEFVEMEDKIKGNDTAEKDRARKFSIFIAELYAHLKVEVDGKLQSVNVLGRGIVDSIEKLLVFPSEENITCMIQVLKLSMINLEAYFSKDNAVYQDKLDRLVERICSLKEKCPSLSQSVANRLDGFIKLRSKCWGKSQVTESSCYENKYSEYGLGSVIYYTPDGKAYTEVDAAEAAFFSDQTQPGDHNAVSDIALNDDTDDSDESISVILDEHVPKEEYDDDYERDRKSVV